MADVLLRDYVEQMRGHLQAGHYSDAIALGHHILRYYPKHLDTYRALAEASLETDDLDAAADLFQRVRSADPENMVALLGLSIVHEHQNKLDEAIWHLERAFEIQPMNDELRKELLRLYAEREGTPRNRLKLTPGALARLYAREGLYPQAIQEFRTILRADPTRVDVQVALAETLYRAGRMQEAAQIAQALLQQLPFCLKANLLLGRLWAENNIADGEKLLQRAQSLDPENTIARELIPDHWEQMQPARLPRLGETPTAGGTAAFSALFDTTPIVRPEAQTVVEPVAPITAAQEAIPATEIELATREAEVVAEPSVEVEPEAAAEIPSPPIEIETAPPAESMGSAQIAPEPVAAWESAPPPPIAKIVEEAPPVPLVKPSLPTVAPTIEVASDKLPAWLQRSSAPPSAAQKSIETSAPPAPSVQPAPPPPPAPAREEIQAPTRLSRLEQLRKQIEEMRAEQQIAPPSPTPENITSTPAPVSADKTEAPPDWLSAVPPASTELSAPPAASVSSTEEELPDWLRSASTTQSTTATPAAPAAPTQEQSHDWLRSTIPAAPSTPAQEEIPEWLASASTSAPAVAQEAATTEARAAETVPTPEHPSKDWLKSLSEAPAESTPTVNVPPVEAAKTPQMEEEPEPLPKWLASAPASTTTESATTEAVPNTSPPEPATAPPPKVEAAPKERAVVEPEAWLAQARELRARGRLAEAVEIYEKVLMRGSQFQGEVVPELEEIARDPQAPNSAHRLLGDVYAMAGRFKESLEQYRLVLGK